MTSDLVLETINPANRLAALRQYTELQNNNTYTPDNYSHTKQPAAHPKFKCSIYTFKVAPFIRSKRPHLYVQCGIISHEKQKNVSSNPNNFS